MVPNGPRVCLLVPVVCPGPLARALCVSRGRPLPGSCLIPDTRLRHREPAEESPRVVWPLACLPSLQEASGPQGFHL